SSRLRLTAPCGADKLRESTSSRATTGERRAMKPHHLFAALAVIAVQPMLAAPAFAQPAAWTVDKAKSKVGFSGSYTGSTFNGTFGKWDATIRFDPADLAGSSAKVTFSTASAATGDSTKDSALAEEDWLNPQKFPDATFTSTSITSS